MRAFILLGEGINFLRILFSSFFSSSNSWEILFRCR
jgi:hypothetical protein